MAYNDVNHKRRVRFVIDIYNQHKHHDVPDTYILRNIFPKHNIYISYRQWMNYKNMPARDLQPQRQLSIF